LQAVPGPLEHMMFGPVPRVRRACPSHGGLRAFTGTHGHAQRTAPVHATRAELVAGPNARPLVSRLIISSRFCLWPGHDGATRLPGLAKNDTEETDRFVRFPSCESDGRVCPHVPGTEVLSGSARTAANA
jgi:hypothetical protein